MKVCRKCGAELVVGGNWHKSNKKVNNYICVECYKAYRKYWNKSTELPKRISTLQECVCEFCGKKFLKYRSQILAGRGRFCSRHCKDEAQRKPRVLRVCVICGKEFELYPSVLTWGTGEYCSRECYHKSRRGEGSNWWNGGSLIASCVNCGKELQIRQYRMESNQLGFFCSSQCWGEWIKEHYKSENNPNWHGGTSFLPYPPEFNEEFKNTVRQRDNYQCVVCQRSANIVHHIDYDKDNTVLSNCVVLCDRCHGFTQHERKRWQRILSNKVGG